MVEMRSERTVHTVPAHSRMYPPEGTGRGQGQGDWDPPRFDKAVTEDQSMRTGWTGGRFLRSPYLTLIELPAKVGAGDRETAEAILGRVVRALAIKGRWTAAERRRLRALRDRWTARAAGDDSYFNLCGWEARGGAGDVRVRQISNTIEEIRGMIK